MPHKNKDNKIFDQRLQMYLKAGENDSLSASFWAASDTFHMRGYESHAFTKK